ncbi:hypothetical protein TL16_g11915 [Triparma laevis f. inornata]|uniref:Uncharacterized protein n=1 Tax=Triparma laevis f. inornata TaxID=1714386 RepID=A0A9W7BRC1_9STRA|nr:hypothetical protein TL16_g11915 [Triparma laevis f. inornata]
MKTSKTTNAHLTTTLTTLQNEIRTLKNQLHSSKSKLEKFDGLKGENEKLKLKVKEFSYDNRKLCNEIERLKQLKQSSEKRTKASLNGLRSALLTVESVVHSRSKNTKEYLKKLTQLQTSFARHLKNGYSNNPSYVAYEMLEKMSRVTAGLKDALERCDDGISSAASETAKNVTEGHIDDGGKGNIMGEICEELEGENGRLRREIERMKEEVEASRVEREQNHKLLPEYRLEIVRSRSGKEQAERELKEERGTVRELQRRLDECVLALRSAERERVEQKQFRRDQDNTDNIVIEEYYPPRTSASPPRWAHHPSSSASASAQNLPVTKPKNTLSEDEELFAKLLQKSNDKLLKDLKESVESKLETVVKQQTDFMLSRSLESASSDKS